MTNDKYLTRAGLAERWNASIRTIDRLRQHRLIPWSDLSAGRGARPIVRFSLADVLAFEQEMRQAGPDVGGADAQPD